jgi:hypothetical protein
LEQQLAPPYGGRAVIQLVPIKDGILDYPGAGRELQPCQIDVFGRMLCGIDVPKVSFDRKAGINLPCDDLEMRKEPLNQPRRWVALTQGWIVHLMNTEVRRVWLPTSLESELKLCQGRQRVN